MTKAISIQTELAQNIAAEVKNRLTEFQRKGCQIEQAQLDKLIAESERIIRCDAKKTAMRTELSNYTAQLNEEFATFKSQVTELKKLIKANYQQYEWKKFGIQDKQ